MSDVGFAGVANFAMTSTATAVRVMGVAGVGGGTEIVAGPSFGLNFVTSAFDGPTLDPRITFSRTTNATRFGSDGQLQYAPHNLLTYSEQFDNAAWGKTNTSVTSNSIAAPDGTTTGDTVTRSTGVTAFIGNSSGAGAASQYTLSLYAKAATAGNGIGLRIQGTFPNRGDVVFNLTDGTISSPAAAAGTATGASATITSAGNGWYRCTITVTLADSLTTCVFAPCETTAPAASFEAASAVASDCYSWGAQLNVGALQPYYSTTVKNLLGFTQEFDNAAWTKNNSTVTANAIAAPDGSMTADKLIPTTTSSDHNITNNGGTAVSGTVYTLSVYAKAAGYNFIRMSFGNVAGGGYTFFNLSNGTIGTTSSMLSNSIVSVGDGWYRCSVVRAASSTATISGDIYVTSANNEFTWAGNGSDGVAIWGAQLSDSASLDPYVYNPAAAPSNTAYYGPRFDYDPVTLAPKGLLIEEQRTNGIRNSTAAGGSAGVLPTNWTSNMPIDGLTSTVSAPAVENGITYINIRIQGTTTLARATINLVAFEGTTVIAALSGQVWTSSAFVKLQAGSMSGITSIGYQLSERNASGTFLDSTRTTFVPTSGALTSQRPTVTRTLNNASTAYILPAISLSYPFGAVIDATFRVGLPQAEQGAFASSPILTSTIALTRAADVASMTGANFSNWYNQTEGTLFAEFGPFGNGGPTKNFGIAQIDDGTSTNMIRLFAGSTIAPVFAVTAGSVIQAYLSSGVIAPTNISKIAGAYKTDSFARSVNGTTTTTDSLGTVPTVNRLLLGSGLVGVGELNGHIRSFTYFPRRLSDAELQALTS